MSEAAQALGMLLTPLYAGPVGLRGCLYDRGWLRAERLPVPVISVGNLTTGGSGKSPTVATIARMLIGRGRCPAIVSRGYHGTHRGVATVVSAGNGPVVAADIAGDEPVMLASSLPGVPVIVARRRRDGGLLALSRFGADCILLDDGYQHRRLARDLDFLLLDGARPFGNGRMLPAGSLREPLAAMSRAGALIITRADGATPAAAEAVARAASRYCPGAPIFHARLRPVDLVEAASNQPVPLEKLAGIAVTCFAGIVAPERFFSAAASCGARVVSGLPYPDHHRFSEGDLTRIRETAARDGSGMLLTTEKDLARLPPAFRASLPSLHALRVSMEFAEAGLLAALIEEALS